MIIKRIKVSHQIGEVCIAANREDDLPKKIGRLGSFKFNFLITGVAQIKSNANVLELFGGSNLGTALLAKKTKKITTLDLHYGKNTDWWYEYEENYARCIKQCNAPQRNPTFVGADACHIPFDKESFDVVLMPDSPRGEFGNGKLVDEQLFKSAFSEACRVVKFNGTVAGTVHESWLPDGMTIKGGSKVSFKNCDDPIIYFRWRKT